MRKPVELRRLKEGNRGMTDGDGYAWEQGLCLLPYLLYLASLGQFCLGIANLRLTGCSVNVLCKLKSPDHMVYDCVQHSRAAYHASEIFLNRYIFAFWCWD